LYDWHPYTLSLGHAQPYSDVDDRALTAQGWDVLRRPTGGRAILHADELTYSICAPQDDLHVSGNVLKSYRMLSAGLLKALEFAGIPADSKLKKENEKQTAANPVCFQHPSDYEITYQGKKLIGSAQARRHQGVLQHGAIPLNGDIDRIISVLSFPDEAARENARRRLLAHATTVSTILGHPASWEMVAQCMVEGFKTALNINLERSSTSVQEKQRAYQLLKEKYANEQWTKRL
jgi:lipoate-protein ligase A